ncbi:M48 family metalloprotease [Cupriavidus pampae]|uniref:Peptidase M48 domain-containing protein n=1 Tax=Cupriavidus pampae TaxID=659251 RepID=A0ABN7ZDS1_9BURK|nr:hypothetical protein [Cupriavidus pampae]CAG9184097.1 hypothetical protein LMG32289_05508 [Cupriavidus pampae]
MAPVAPTRLNSAQWVDTLSKAEQQAVIDKYRIVQSWIHDFAAQLGRRRGPTLKISHYRSYYHRWRNVIAVPARTLMLADERLLRILLAHECGHFARRWISMLALTERAYQREEMLADQAAMRLTVATQAELDAAVREIARLEEEMDSDELEAYIAIRRRLQQPTRSR